MVPSVASEKIPATPLGIDPETLRLAAQRLNHNATPGPLAVTTYRALIGMSVACPVVLKGYIIMLLNPLKSNGYFMYH
jgi:hypothetical protein